MTIWQCMLVAAPIIPIVYFYRFRKLYKEYLDSFTNMAILNYLFLMNYCSVQNCDGEFGYSARFVECEVFDAFAEPLGLLLQNCVKERIFILDKGNEGVPVFQREKLLAMMKKVMDEAEARLKNYSELDPFTRCLLSRVQKEYDAAYQELVSEYEMIEEKKESLISYH